MVDDYLSDREQEEALRNWWRENWRWILGGIVLGVALLFGWFRWQDYRVDRGVAAAQAYDELKTAVAAADTDKAAKELADLTGEHEKSPYAQQGRLLVAKLYVDSGKYDEALTLLRATAETTQDEELGYLAKLRAARVLIQQGKHDEAIASLKADELGAFAATAHEIRGDANVAKGDEAAARAEYAAALAGDDARIDRAIVELKLQEVGGSAPEPAPAGKAEGQP
jgi:predicted negative regulator of RcsB-dependent stress response